MFEQDFESMLRSYADAIDDKKRFTGLVKDFFPEQAKNINLLLIAYTLGIAQEMKRAPRIGNAFAFRYVKQMMEDYGISRSNADWVVSVWCVCFGERILGKECDIKLQQPGSGPAVKEESKDTRSYGDLFCYQKSSQGNGLAVCGFDGDKSQTIIFQNKYKNQPVIEIGDEAFMNMPLQEVVMTDGIIYIGKRAFADCDRLHQIVFPFTVKEIGNQAMANCSALKSITLPMGLERIGAEALKGTSLRTIKIPNTLYWLGDGVFENCVNLDNVELPRNIDRIPDRMFAGCSSLHKFEMSNTVTEIGEKAFYNCSSLDILSIPESVQSIGANAFTGTNKLFIIQCAFGSYAEDYARRHKIKYQLI